MGFNDKNKYFLQTYFKSNKPMEMHFEVVSLSLFVHKASLWTLIMNVGS